MPRLPGSPGPCATVGCMSGPLLLTQTLGDWPRFPSTPDSMLACTQPHHTSHGELSLWLPWAGDGMTIPFIIRLRQVLVLNVIGRLAEVW